MIFNVYTIYIKFIKYYMNNLYSVIIAGGLGGRLWPSSRRAYPKQIKPLIDNETMLQANFARLSKIVALNNILVCTNVEYQDYCLQQLPDITKDQLVLEPVARNTAAAVGLSAAILVKKNPEAIMLNVWADSYISREDEYKDKVLLAVKLLKDLPEHLIVIPAEPLYPAIGYGYLQTGDVITQQDGINIYKVDKFVEKPDLETAKKYLADGNFYWNTGIFVCKAYDLLNLYKQYMPEMYLGLLAIQAAWGTEKQEMVMNEIFPKLESLQIDYAIFEKTNKLALIPANLGWSDIGSWQSIYDLIKHKSSSDMAIKGNVIEINSKNTLVFNEDNDKLVAVAGLNNIVVVNTKDAVLVIDKNSDQTVKDIISKIKTKKMTQYL